MRESDGMGSILHKYVSTPENSYIRRVLAGE